MKSYHPRVLTLTEQSLAVVWKFVVDKWIRVLILVFTIYIGYRIVKWAINNYLFTAFKHVLGIPRMLSDVKTILETPYDEYVWEDYEFCKGYLDLFATFRELRIASKRNVTGVLDVNAIEFARFDNIKLCRIKKEDDKEGEYESDAESNYVGSDLD
uniref:Innexin n=1 Tax=Rhabditophanes sp. KR3021 TaxID=114890 RepID=A0AC35UFG7_9BILA